MSAERDALSTPTLLRAVCDDRACPIVGELRDTLAENGRLRFRLRVAFLVGAVGAAYLLLGVGDG